MGIWGAGDSITLGGLLAFQPRGWHQREWSCHSSFLPCWLSLTQE